MSKVDIAVVAKKGLTSESMWRHMGENRAEFMESAKAIMGLDDSNEEKMTPKTKFACIWSSCKQADSEQASRQAAASALGVAMPLEQGSPTHRGRTPRGQGSRRPCRSRRPPGEARSR